MQSFTLRPADWEDLPAFKHIARTTLHENISEQLDPQKLLEDKKIGFEYIMAAEQNGEVVGFCCRYACRDADTPYCAEIFSLCVLPKAQHSGIGRAFVEDALAILYISGFKTCSAISPPEVSPSRNRSPSVCPPTVTCRVLRSAVSPKHACTSSMPQCAMVSPPMWIILLSFFRKRRKVYLFSASQVCISRLFVVDYSESDLKSHIYNMYCLEMHRHV